MSASDGSQRHNNNNRKHSRRFHEEPNQGDPWWASLVKSKLSGPVRGQGYGSALKESPKDCVLKSPGELVKVMLWA